MRVRRGNFRVVTHDAASIDRLIRLIRRQRTARNRRRGCPRERGGRRIAAGCTSHIARANPMAENRKRKFWGWGYEDQGPTPEQQKHMAERMAKGFVLGPLGLAPRP